MPQVNILLDKIGGAHVLATIDLTKRYWQIPFAKEPCYRTTFATPLGLYQFTKMPFSLNGAATYFQQVMDKALKPVQDCVVIYIDDMLIVNPSWKAHIKHLRRVLEVLHDTSYHQP